MPSPSPDLTGAVCDGASPQPSVLGAADWPVGVLSIGSTIARELDH